MEDQNFFHHFLLLYRPFIKELNKKLEEYDLYSSQWSIMFYINKFERITLVEISNHLFVEKPTITRAVRRLEELNYIEQIYGENKRVKEMRLTELGHTVYKDIRSTLDQFQSQIMNGVSDQELQEIIRLMGNIRRNITDREIMNE